jgi:hypothetical protein
VRRAASGRHTPAIARRPRIVDAEH